MTARIFNYAEGSSALVQRIKKCSNVWKVNSERLWDPNLCLWHWKIHLICDSMMNKLLSSGEPQDNFGITFMPLLLGSSCFKYIAFLRVSEVYEIFNIKFTRYQATGYILLKHRVFPNRSPNCSQDVLCKRQNSKEFSNSAEKKAPATSGAQSWWYKGQRIQHPYHPVQLPDLWGLTRN